MIRANTLQQPRVGVGEEVVAVDSKLGDDELAAYDFVDSKLDESAANMVGNIFLMPVPGGMVTDKVVAKIKRAWESGGWSVEFFRTADGGWLAAFARGRGEVVHATQLPAVASAATSNATSGARLLVRMPTRGRPLQAVEVLRRYRAMAGAPVKIEVVVDADDKETLRADVLQRMAALDCVVTVGRHESKVEACNGGRVSDWDILMLASDDMWPVASGWARRVLDAMEKHWPHNDGASFFDDGFQGDKLCTLPIIGRRLYDQFGFVYNPAYKSLYCDREQTEVLRVMGRLTYVDEKIIEHRHHLCGRVEVDATYERNDKYEEEDKKTYERRMELVKESNVTQLSILICTLPARRAQLNHLLDELYAQTCRWQREVEILVDDRDGVTIGEKRNALVARARGTFVAFVDDDDGVAHDYVDRVARALICNPDVDCASLVGEMTTDGGRPERFEHSLKYDEWRTNTTGETRYERSPNHLNAIRRELVLRAGFVASNRGEDFAFSKVIKPLLKKEVSTGNEPLYYYWFDSKKFDKKQFTVEIAHLITKPHNKCFEDFSAAFACALRDLGHEIVPLGGTPAEPIVGRLVMFGLNEVDAKIELPKDAIIYNTEQIALVSDPRELIARTDRVVLDYSAANVKRWKSIGVRAIHCPVGYHPSMETIELPRDRVPPEFEDVDVLFYGWMNDRRRDVLTAIFNAGMNVKTPSNVYGKKRDAWIARSKVVLNLHYNDRGIFEIFRVSHLLANKKCVVTEATIMPVDSDLEDFARRSCARVPVEEIVETCKRLVDDADARRAQAERGYNEFKKIDLVTNVRKALEELALVESGV